MGKPIIEHQAVGFMLADMAISVEAARGLVLQAAWAKDVGERNSTSLDYSLLMSSLQSISCQDLR